MESQRMQLLMKSSITPAPGQTTISVPQGAILLSLDWFQDSLIIYFIAETGNQPETRNILIASAGDKIPKINMRFIGSTFLDTVNTDYHLFELT